MALLRSAAAAAPRRLAQLQVGVPSHLSQYINYMHQDPEYPAFSAMQRQFEKLFENFFECNEVSQFEAFRRDR